MLDPNKASGEPSDGATGWESVASMAGKMNKPITDEESNLEASKETHQDNEGTEAIRQELETISKQISYLEQQMAPLERRRAEANSRLNGDGEEFREKSYSWGNGDAVENGGGYNFDDYMRDTKGIGPKLAELREQKEELENRRRELLEKIEDTRRKDEISESFNSPEEQPSEAEKERIERQMRRDNERVNDFVNGIGEREIRRTAYGEALELRDQTEIIEKREEMYDSYGRLLPGQKRSIADKFIDSTRGKADYEAAKKYRIRSGYSPSIGEKNSEIYNSLRKGITKNGDGVTHELMKIGENRARDYMRVKIALGSERGKALSKWMKKAGIAIPESWDDTSKTTSDELHRAAVEAHALYYL